jgi:hypothetical protein
VGKDARTAVCRWASQVMTRTGLATSPADNSDVTVHFVAKDDDAGSGIKSGSVTADVVVSDETDGREITGTAEDLAGNVGSDKVTVKLDKTAPSISGEVVQGTMGGNAWTPPR